MNSIGKADILRLSIPERIALVGDIWDSIAARPEEVPVTEAQQAALDQRLEAYRNDPEAGSRWEVVRERIQGGE